MLHSMESVSYTHLDVYKRQAQEINKKYSDKKFEANKLMTKHVRISYNSRKHRRNLLTIAVGGSGSGKTRFFCKPNLMQANTSFVVLDPKGENLRDTGHLLEAKGYEEMCIRDSSKADMDY